MANKRVSDLAPIIAADLAGSDLLLLADVTANESKKLTLTDLSSYILSNGNITGSLYGTASYAVRALSASFVSSVVSSSYVSTSSWATNVVNTQTPWTANVNANFKSLSNVLSLTITSSNPFGPMVSITNDNGINSGDYLKIVNYTGNAIARIDYYGDYIGTSSWATNVVNSFIPTLSNSASYLVYAGVANGTASNARTSSYTLNTPITWSHDHDGAGSYGLYNLYQLRVVTVTDTVPLIVSRTGDDISDLTQWKNSLGITKASVDATGKYIGTSSYATSASYVSVAASTPYATNAGYADTAGNGTFQKILTTISCVTQSNTSVTQDSPDDISGSVITIIAGKTNPTYLINMSISVGGATGIGLWRSSSLESNRALIKSIAFYSASYGSINTISTTFLEAPTAVIGDTIIYKARAYNETGNTNYYINKSFDGTRFGTSSMSVIEL